MDEDLFKKLIQETEPPGSEDVLDSIKIFEMGLRPSEIKGPIGSYILAGPTGSGKTHYVGALSRALHGSESFIRINCGEFALPHEVARLIGAPPGYLGHRETSPLLTQRALNEKTSERSPISVLLFDEIEKAHPDIQKFLLGIMDTQNGTISLGDNTKVVFHKTLIFFTTNLGSDKKKVNFDFTGLPQVSPHLTAIRSAFSPEFLGRVTKVLEFQELARGKATRILIEILTEQRLHLESLGYQIIFDNSILDPILDRGYSKTYGIRELKRAVDRMVLVPVARSAHKHMPLTLQAKGDTLVLEPTTTSLWVPTLKRGRKAA